MNALNELDNRTDNSVQHNVGNVYEPETASRQDLPAPTLTTAPAATANIINANRYVLFPLQDDEIWKMYKKQVDCFWRAEEIDLSKAPWPQTP